MRLNISHLRPLLLQGFCLLPRGIQGESLPYEVDQQLTVCKSAACRADFEDARAKSEYERGYKILVTFFHEHL